MTSTARTIRIRPADGRRMRHPNHPANHPQSHRKGQVLKPEGETVAWSSYWERALQAGDVILVEEKPTPPPAPTAPPPPPAKSKDGDAQ